MIAICIIRYAALSFDALDSSLSLASLLRLPFSPNFLSRPLIQQDPAVGDSEREIQERDTGEREREMQERDTSEFLAWAREQGVDFDSRFQVAHTRGGKVYRQTEKDRQTDRQTDRQSRESILIVACM